MFNFYTPENVRKTCFLEFSGVIEMKHWAEMGYPLSVNPTKWSNTLKQFVRKSQQIVSVCLTIL